jgi:hypothetical protein
MKRLSLSEYLNADNKWTRRLLGLEDFSVQRTPEKIHQEYGREKWGRLLQHELRDLEHAKDVELEILVGPDWRTQVTALSFKDEIFGTTHTLARRIYFDLIRTRFEKYTADCYCELGCGFGYNLSLFNGVTYGGEFTDAGIMVGRKLGLDVGPFDFYDRASYKIIRRGSLVFTIQALEQISDTSKFLEGMRSQRDKVTMVLHMEPTMLASRHNLLGLLRNRYIELNDYCRNLVELLQRAPDIEILEFDPDCIGRPPLTSLHFIAWRFR